MPRPIKEGLDYFPLDVDLDDKIYMVECELGLTGFALLIKLFIKIYKNGYYANWNEKIAKMFARQNNIEIDIVNKFLDVCINEKIINGALYEKYNILTSRGIQKRYLEAAKRRKEIALIKEYMCIKNVDKSVNANINWIDVDNNSIDDDDNKQSRVEKSREEKRREEKKREEVGNQPFQEIQKDKKKANDIEYDFEAQYWHGLDDDILEVWEKKFPMLNIALELQDKLRGKFKLKPKYYQKLIKTKYNGNFALFIFDWLEGSKKFYLQDHPEYKQNIGRNINHIKKVIKNLKIIKDKEN